MKSGLSWTPQFCMGDDPYEGITWERRDVVVREGDRIVFQQKNVEVPSTWSDLALSQVCQKYFRGKVDEDGTPREGRETSVREIVERVANPNADWAGYADAMGGPWHHRPEKTIQDPQEFYFDSHVSWLAWKNDLKWLLIHQHMAFNSPVWFNVGRESYAQTAACFINRMEDWILGSGDGDSETEVEPEDLMDHHGLAAAQVKEILIFSNGSGSGIDLSRIRSKREFLSGGGKPSGPIAKPGGRPTFAEGLDIWASTIHSGGKCLPGWQPVYTTTGPVPVQTLQDRMFCVLSFDPPAGRFKVKRARAWLSGEKRVVRITTDKGRFDLSADHPIKLSTGEFVRADQLKTGMSLFSCTTYEMGNYVRVNLRDGRKGKDLLHRMVARDVLGMSLDGSVVHHRDGNGRNNHETNLECMTQVQHATHHGVESAQAGEHIFQRVKFNKHGSANGMSRQNFWENPLKAEEAERLRNVQSQILSERNPVGLQDQAATVRMMNLAYRLINAGYAIDTFEEYVIARQQHVGRIANVKKVRASIDRRFGSYQGFIDALAAHNHRVQSVQDLGHHVVYSVEVDCPTADDKSPMSGHNFVIWDGDSPFGSGIVVSNTRRAAKMLLLDVDHPDILDFIRIKAWQEEHVVKSLVASGSSTKMDDYAYSQAWHQNSNLSVSVNRRFMEAVEDRESWDLVSRTHHYLEDLPIRTTMLGTEGRVMETVKAYDLFEEIGRSAWRCGDPGLRFHDTINDWNTCADTEEIKCCNPCAEYNFLDDTSCNLASLNLKRFFVNGVFDVVKYVQAVRATAIAMDVWISNSRFPTRRIRDRTTMYRTLGLGHANLGGLLMQMGLPYNSDSAREVAAMLTSLLTATTYATSADMAMAIGPFSAFEANRGSCTNVMKKHHLAHLNLNADTVWAETDWYRDASKTAGRFWRDVVQACEKGTGIRNAQATVMAPTGTIAFLMDCDTTGIEPELALVKWKALAGGGYLPIFSKIDGVLTSLGYEGDTLKQIHDHLAAKKSIRLCPALKPEHHEIFRTSFPPIDDPEFSLPWLAHVEMMAAIQPFVSGAISKTVNCPEETTVEDIMGIYQTAYHAGLKSIAIYRDGSKFTQAVSTREYEKDQEDQDSPDENLMAELESKIAVLEAQVSELAKRQGRQKLDRNVVTGRTKFIIDGNKGFIHVGFFSDTWQIAEIFMRFSKRGSTMDGMLDAICIAYSKLLQYGMDSQELIDDLEWTQFQPYGPILADPDVKTCTSPLDYLAKKVRAIRERVHDEESYLRTYRADSSGLPKETVAPVASTEPGLVRKLGRSCPKCGTSPILVERNCIKCMFCGYDEGGCFA